MIRKKKLSGKIAMLVIVAALCMIGCGEKKPVQTGGAKEFETVPEKTEEKVLIYAEEPAADETKETAENIAEVFVQSDEKQVENIPEETETSEDIKKTESSLDFDVVNALGEAEDTAAALEKKLKEDKNLNQADLNTLSYDIYMVWDNLLNELWSVLQENVSPEIMNGLLEEQREWITEKEAEVKKAAAGVGGGSMASMVANQRAAKLTRARVYGLAAYLGYEDNTITFVVEGMEEVVPAAVFEGLRYTISIPMEGWEMIARECWASENGDAQIWITDYDGEEGDLVQEKLINVGYELSESDSFLFSMEDEEGQMHHVKLYAENGETIGVFYRYPVEAAERFGVRLHTIADTFDWK